MSDYNRLYNLFEDVIGELSRIDLTEKEAEARRTQAVDTLLSIRDGLNSDYGVRSPDARRRGKRKAE